MTSYNVHMPAELIPELTAWLNEKGWGINGTGALLEGDVRPERPTLIVWKHQNNPAPKPFLSQICTCTFPKNCVCQEPRRTEQWDEWGGHW